MLDKISLIFIQLLVIFVPFTYFILPDNNHAVGRIIFGILGLLYLVILLFKIYIKKTPLKNIRLKIPLLTFLFIMLVSAKNAGNVKLVFESAAFFLILLAILYSLSLFSESERNVIINTFIISSAVITAYSFVLHLSINFFKWLPNSMVDFNINIYSGYLLLIFPIIFVKMILIRGVLKHVLLMLFCFIIFFNLVITKTCSIWVIFLISILLLICGQMVYLRRRFNSIKRISRGSYWIALIVCAILLFSIDKHSLLKKYICRSDVLVNNFITYFNAAWQTVKEHPFFGIGAGNALNCNSGVFIKHFIEIGILGLITNILIFISYFYFCAGSLLKNIELKENDYNTLLGIFIGVFSYFLYTFTINSFFVFPVYIILFIFFGLTESYLKNPSIIVKPSSD
ncbi:MAG: hypothetical protein A2539_08040 [Elusimicrobia bacterium RIFOXYD2_FULL_34_15]|nr:MAG: hypothetical protein A2539_08040 [Elusimicrobia bacterium RIFOXYD2_FULL_34_15]